MRKVIYKTRVCEHCKKEFQPTSSTQKFCEQCLHKKCEVCGKTFKVRNKSKLDKAIYCSNKCRMEGWKSKYIHEKAPNYRNGNRSKKISVQCIVCKKEIQRELSQTHRNGIYFCSGECKGIYYKEKYTGEGSPRYSQIEVICEFCGKLYFTYQCTEGKRRFCSKLCRAKWQAIRMKGAKHPNWKGGSSEYRSRAWVSKEYKAWRKAVFERDLFTCQYCGDAQGGNLNAHHIKPFAKFPSLRYELSNGITLCEKCHIQEHKRLKDIQSELHV